MRSAEPPTQETKGTQHDRTRTCTKPTPSQSLPHGVDSGGIRFGARVPSQDKNTAGTCTTQAHVRLKHMYGPFAISTHKGDRMLWREELMYIGLPTAPTDFIRRHHLSAEGKRLFSRETASPNSARQRPIPAGQTNPSPGKQIPARAT